MKQRLWPVLVASAVFVNTVGCGGGGNTVEFPESPDPMPKEPPVAAGVPAPSEPPKTTEQP
jgi:hypothetical protein